jgi:hypothetical protein
MSWIQGVNFRGSSGYVTDGASTGYEIATTANYTGARTLAAGDAVGIGWEDAPTLSLDRDVVDARISGAAFVTTSGSPFRYRIDLPSAGDYTIAVASCDAAGGSWDAYTEIFDNTTSLGVVNNRDTITANNYVNVNNTQYAAGSPANIDDTQTFTFASTILRVKVGLSSHGAAFTMLSHLLVTQVAAAGGGGPIYGSGILVDGPLYNGRLTK